MEFTAFVIKSIILGIVEGVTEFLPVSSTGHLVIFQGLLNFKSSNPQYVEMYTYVIQLGAILAVILLYWKKIKDTLVNFFPQKAGYEKSGFRFWFVIFVACIPGVIVKLALDDIADKYLFNAVSVAAALFFGALLLMFIEKRFRHKNSGNEELHVTMKQAVIIGLFQCLSIIPGMSRSASTIMGGWISGLSTVAAAEFSFFLAIPVMAGMSFLEIVKIGGFSTLSSQELIALAVGFIVSFIVALVVVNKFIAYLKKKPMKVFAIYRMIFAVFVLAAGFFGIFK